MLLVAIDEAALAAQLGPIVEASVREAHIEKKSFSQATSEFGKAILKHFSITWETKKLTNPGNAPSFTNFNWDVEFKSGGVTVTKENEVAHMADARLHLTSVLSLASYTLFDDSSDFKLELVDVHKDPPFSLECKGKRASGGTDLVLKCMGQVVAPIELKTSRAALNSVQLVLELVAASRISQYGQGVAALGTDLQVPLGKWHIAYFAKRNKIRVDQYTSPDLALVEFKRLVLSCPKRGHELQPLNVITETGGDSEGEGEEKTHSGPYVLLSLFVEFMSRPSTSFI